MTPFPSERAMEKTESRLPSYPANGFTMTAENPAFHRYLQATRFVLLMSLSFRSTIETSSASLILSAMRASSEREWYDKMQVYLESADIRGSIFDYPVCFLQKLLIVVVII